MKWVKASERLPPIGKDCNLKIDNMPFSGRYWDAESEHMSHLTYQHFNVAGKTILDSQHFHRIYWLDESQSGEGDAVDEWDKYLDSGGILDDYKFGLITLNEAMARITKLLFQSNK